MELPVIRHLFAGIVLVALTVTIHSLGTAFIMGRLTAYRRRTEKRAGRVHSNLILTGLVSTLLVLHVTEVVVWGTFFDLRHCFPDAETSLYFSMITYTTVGHGDAVLSREWRMIGGIEALVGMLMVGWSTAILLGAVNWTYRYQTRKLLKEGLRDAI
jgi:voltage-gated potassium channel